MLTYIQGDQVHEWVEAQVTWLMEHLCNRANSNKEYLYDTIIDWFSDTNTDTITMQQAKHNLKTHKMHKGELDDYVAKFESLAQQANYNLAEDSVIEIFIEGLNPGPAKSIITHSSPLPRIGQYGSRPHK